MCLSSCLETHKSRRVRSFEILLVVENEAVAQAVSATLRHAGHRVTVSTTIASTVETLMRCGPGVDVILTSARFDSSLGDVVLQYSRRFAAGARFVVLREVTGQVEDIERTLVERLCMTSGWN